MTGPVFFLHQHADWSFEQFLDRHKVSGCSRRYLMTDSFIEQVVNHQSACKPIHQYRFYQQGKEEKNGSD